MRVAILIPGQYRFFRENLTILSLKNYYKADIYIHTWDLPEKKSYLSPYCELMGVYDQDPADFEEYINFFNPKKFSTDKELSEEFIHQYILERDTSQRETKGMKYNIFRYYFSLKKCFELARDDNYDVYIITRSDMLIIRMPILSKEYIISSMIHNHNELIESYYLDNMLISVPGKFMERYLEIIEKLDFYYDRGYSYNFDHLMFAHLYESKLINDTKFFGLDQFYFEIKRNESGTKKHRLW
jgi:hypothetical protein